MLQEVMPGVVSVAVRGRVAVELNPLFQDPFFRRFFGVPQQEREVRSAGSGVIVDAARGYLLTNEHVIQHADIIMVTLRDGRHLQAKVVGSDPETDVALLKIQPEELDSVPLGDSDALQVGDFVVAIGNPFGLGHTVTSGIVSALGRSGLGIEGYEEFIQTDASINPGNSGGALVNLRGELVGVNTAIVAPAGGNVGIGFAIPINMARRIMLQLIDFGEVRRGLLGVHMQDLTPDLAEALHLDLRAGAVVNRVLSGSPADQVGIRRGDVITHVEGVPVAGAAAVRNRIGSTPAGETLEFTLLRDGKRRTVRATIGGRRVPETARGGPHPRLHGATLSDVPPAPDGSAAVLVKAVERGSPAWALGLRHGDLILAANRQRVNNVKELRKVAQAGGRGVLLHVRRGSAALYLYAQ
jgi:serine protease Do/serine protease DegQ